MFGKDKEKKAQEEALRSLQIQAEKSKKKFSEEIAILEKKLREDVTNY